MYLLNRTRSRTGRRSLVALAASAALMLAGCAGATADAGAGTDTSPPAGTVSEQSAGTVSEQSAGTVSEQSADPGTPTTSSGPSYPVTIDAANGAVTIARQPTRIVSLSPTATEMLYAIGAGDQVVAVDINADYPGDLPDLRFNALQLNVESLTKADPDLIVASYIDQDQAAKFDALGMTALTEPAAVTLEDTYRQIGQLGAATGHVARAAELVATMKSEVDEIVSGAPTFDTSPTYYYELDQTLYSATSDTFIGHLLGMLHLTNIADSANGAAAAGGYPQLSDEFILKADPDYIILADSQCCGQSAATVAARPGWDALGAVREHRVIAVDDDLASRWGPRVPQLLSAVSDALAESPPTS